MGGLLTTRSWQLPTRTEHGEHLQDMVAVHRDVVFKAILFSICTKLLWDLRVNDISSGEAKTCRRTSTVAAKIITHNRIEIGRRVIIFWRLICAIVWKGQC